MFEVHHITNYDEDTNIGRAIVIMNKNKAIEFIFIINANNNWFFHYENGTEITEEERTALEDWFIDYYATSSRDYHLLTKIGESSGFGFEIKASK